MKKTLELRCSGGGAGEEMEVHFPTISEVANGEEYGFMVNNEATASCLVEITDGDSWIPIYSVDIKWSNGKRIVHKRDYRKKYAALLSLFK